MIDRGALDENLFFSDNTVPAAAAGEARINSMFNYGTMTQLDCVEPEVDVFAPTMHSTPTMAPSMSAAAIGGGDGLGVGGTPSALGTAVSSEDRAVQRGVSQNSGSNPPSWRGSFTCRVACKELLGTKPRTDLKGPGGLITVVYCNHCYEESATPLILGNHKKPYTTPTYPKRMPRVV